MFRVSPLILLLLPCGCSEEPAVSPTSATAPAPAPAMEIQARPAQPRDLLLRALPEDALVCIHLPNLQRAWSDLAGTVFGPSLAAVERVDLASQLQPMYESLILEFAEPPFVAAPWSEVDRMIHAVDGEVMLALLDLQGFDQRAPVIRALGGFTVRGAGDAASQVVETLIGIARITRGVEYERTGKVWTIRTGDENPVFEIGVEDDVVLFGIGEQVVREGFQRLRRPQIQYQGIQPGEQFHADDLARIHIHLTELLQRYAGHLPELVRQSLNALRFDRWTGLSAAIRVEDTQFLTTCHIASPGGHDLLSRLLTAHTVDGSLLAELPLDLDAFTLFTLNPAWILKNLQAGLPPAAGTALESILERVRARGFDLSERTLATFGPQCAHVSLKPIGELPPGPVSPLEPVVRSAWIIEVRDHSRARHLFDRLCDGVPSRRRYRIGMAEALTFHLAENILPGVQLAPSVAITKDHLYLAFSENSLRRSLDSGDATSAKEYRERIEAAPKGVASVTWDSMRSPDALVHVLATIRNRARQMGVDLPVAVRGEALRAGGEKPISALAWTRADETGVTTHTGSPTGAASRLGGLTGLGILASIAVPNLLRARTNANEASAIATLSNIRSAQEQYRLSTYHDQDGDEVGEYGYLSDLMQPSRGKPLLATIPGAGGRFLHNGYLFRVFLPGRAGVPLGETGEAATEVDANLAERFFVAMAWPLEQGETGRRTFLLNTNGEIFCTRDGGYGGRKAPSPDVLSFEPGNIVSRALENGVLARDGRQWQRVQ